MTDRLRAAAEAALEALELSYMNGSAGLHKFELNEIGGAIEKLRAALAEPTCKQDLQVAEQDAEPFLWYADDTGDTWTPDAVVEGWAPTDLRPLYANPPRREWMSLTDDEITEAIRALCPNNETLNGLIAISMDEYRAIEAALKDKNEH